MDVPPVRLPGPVRAGAGRSLVALPVVRREASVVTHLAPGKTLGPIDVTDWLACVYRLEAERQLALAAMPRWRRFLASLRRS